MAFTVEGNFALKDMLIRSEFRLVDVEVRVGDFRSPNRVSSLLQRQLAGREAQLELINNQVLPPGIRALEGFGGGPAGTAGGPMEGPPTEPGAAMEITGKQVYSLRARNGAFNVTRSAQITSDGILVRVSGGVVAAFDFGSFDDGLRLLISDSDQVTTVDRVGGDFDIFTVGRGGDPTTSHGIGVNNQVTAVGHPSVDNFDIGFFRPVRAGQRFGVDLNAGGIVEYWAVFEVAQFSNVRSSRGYVGQQIRDSVPVDPSPPVFQPVIMQQSIFRPSGRVVESLAEVNQLLQLGWIIVGNVFPDGIFST